MTRELIYTSAPRGLLPGSQGFCTVAATQGLPPSWREALEGLSGYRPLFAPDDPRNPVVYAHQRVTVGGAVRSVLSRIGPAGLDYSGRTNKLAHHLIFEPTERPAAGPAWLLARPGLFQTSWDGQIGWRPAGPVLPDGSAATAPCRAWERLTGDAGWAGVLAEAYADNPRRPAVLVFAPGTDILPLIAEAALLAGDRWGVTFSTYFTALPPAAECLWRGVIAGSPEAKAAMRLPGAFVLDLTAPLGRAAGGPLVEAARTGRVPARAVAATPRGPDWESAPPSTPRVPRSEDLAWPSAGPPPRVGPPPPPFLRSKPRRRTAVWVVLIAALIGAAGAGGLLLLRPREVAPAPKIVLWAYDELPPDQQADVLVRMLAAPTGRGLVDGLQVPLEYAWSRSSHEQYVTIARAEAAIQCIVQVSKQIRQGTDDAIDWIAARLPPLDGAIQIYEEISNRRNGASSWLAQRISDWKKRSAHGPAKKLVAPLKPLQEPMVLSVLGCRRRGENQCSINIDATPNTRIRFISLDSGLLVADPSGTSAQVTVTAHKGENPQIKAVGFDKPLVRLRLEGSGLKLEVLDRSNDHEDYWRRLLDSVIVIADPGAPPRHVFLRECVVGSYDHREDSSIRLRWNAYDRWEPMHPLLVGTAEVSRTITVQESYRDNQGKLQTRPVPKPVGDELKAASGSNSASGVSEHDRTELSIRVESPTRAVLSVTNAQTTRDVKLVGLKLYEAVGGIKIPVFVIQGEPVGLAGGKP